MLALFSSGIKSIPYLSQFVNESIHYRPITPKNISAVAVWGARPSGKKACAWAKKHYLPLWRLEDGFIRSLGLGVKGYPPLSMVIDKEGIYYDASTPSTLERLIQDHCGNHNFLQNAQEAMALIRKYHLSKYNHAPDFTCEATPAKPVVLVVDQTAGDMAVIQGGASAETFRTMLDTAIAEHPQAEVWVKIHPDVLSGKKQGYLGALMPDYPHVKWLTVEASPLSLLAYVQQVYVVTSHYGFEALLAGKTVNCFGLPWFAGWGLTHDRHLQAGALATRRGRASLYDLFIAAYLRYSRYIHPQTGESTSLLPVLEWLILQRCHHLARQGTLYCPGMSLWKQSIVKPFLHTPLNKLTFTGRGRQADARVIWGVANEESHQLLASHYQQPLWRMEDGFLRSCGLGSDLYPPLSLVLDKSGIYYDARRPSDLENLLNHQPLEEAQRLRAQHLYQRLITLKLSKYNIGNPYCRPATDRMVILVPGQVEDDASIRTGSPTVKSNRTLLTVVRHRYPHAWIIYKPHPDVVAGNRKGAIPADLQRQLADEVVTDADIIDCILAADEVHTMTSLAGFEALLHGKTVVCYGLPFYAGWGLTQDRIPCPRRQARPDLLTVLFHLLVNYASYIHPLTGQLLTPEQAIDWLEHQPKGTLLPSQGFHNWWQRKQRKLKQLINVIR